MTCESSKAIAEVPQEMWDQIAKDLSLTDILALRRTCKKASTTSPTCTRLYLHPTRLQDVISFCNEESGFLRNARKSIEEIVILGMRDPTIDGKINNVIRQYHHYPWPHATAPLPTSQDPRLAASRSWRINYHSLIEALGVKSIGDRMPKLKQIAYMNTAAEEEGFCAVPQSTIRSHAVGSRVDPVTLDNSLPSRPDWTDEEMLFGILMFARRPFVALNLGQPIFDLAALRWSMLSPNLYYPDFARDNGVFGQEMERLQHLQYTSSTARSDHGILQRVLSPAKNLTSLRLDCKAMSQTTWRRGEAEGLIWAFRWCLEEAPVGDSLGGKDCCTKLEKVVIESYQQIPDSLRGGDVIKSLERCRGVLKDVQFKNVFFGSASNLKQDMRDVAQFLKDCRLQNANLTVRCVEIDEIDNDAKKFYDIPSNSGEPYRDYSNIRFDRTVFDELAAELGVEERDGWWDFADNNLVASDEGQQAQT